jgi:hypothetical protein
VGQRILLLSSRHLPHPRWKSHYSIYRTRHYLDSRTQIGTDGPTDPNRSLCTESSCTVSRPEAVYVSISSYHGLTRRTHPVRYASALGRGVAPCNRLSLPALEIVYFWNGFRQCDQADLAVVLSLLEERAADPISAALG